MESHPVIERYISRLESAIGELDPADREEIIREIRNHIAEANAAGRPLDIVLESLGSADVLARAYAAELLLHPRRSQRLRSFEPFARTVGLVIVGGIMTLLVVGWLGSLVGLGLSGAALFIIGLLEASGVHVPGVQMNGVSPFWAMLLGPALTLVGFVALVILRMYLRFLGRAWRRLLPRNRATLRAA